MAIDRRRVLNPIQARTLFKAVGEQAHSGPRLVAFFGCLYFAGLRSEEAVALRRSNLDLPPEGWGTITSNAANPTQDANGPTAARTATCAPQARDDDEVQPVPCADVPATTVADWAGPLRRRPPQHHARCIDGTTRTSKP